MAGMSDNPLVGEYTKGISKGHAYFVALDARCKREKFNAERIVSDLEMGLIRDQKARVALSISLSGLGRFAPKVEQKASELVRPIARRVDKKIRENSCFAERVKLLQKHFCG